jgi:hypothetical protein
LLSLGTANILSRLSQPTIDKLSQTQFVGVDTGAAHRSCQACDMYQVAAFYLEPNGNEQVWYSHRHHYNPDDVFNSIWQVWVNRVLVLESHHFDMLSSLSGFCKSRTIIIYTGNTACDYKRIVGAYSTKPQPEVNEYDDGEEFDADYTFDDVAENFQAPDLNLIHDNPFPEESQWFNAGKDLVQHVIGPVAVPIISTYWKLSIIHPQLYSAGGHMVSAGENIVTFPTDRESHNVIQDSMRAWNVVYSFKNALVMEDIYQQ